MATIKLLKPDGQGIMESVFRAYAPDGGVSKAAFLALLSDLGVAGAHADTVTREALWEVSALSCCGRAL